MNRDRVDHLSDRWDPAMASTGVTSGWDDIAHQYWETVRIQGPGVVAGLSSRLELSEGIRLPSFTRMGTSTTRRTRTSRRPPPCGSLHRRPAWSRRPFLYGYSGLRWDADAVRLDPSLTAQLSRVVLHNLPGMVTGSRSPSRVRRPGCPSTPAARCP
jgi:hypothetical protein